MDDGTGRPRFSERFSELVSECGIQRKTLAHKTSRSPATITHWLHGATLPNSREVVRKLERLLLDQGASVGQNELVELWEAERERLPKEGIEPPGAPGEPRTDPRPDDGWRGRLARAAHRVLPVALLLLVASVGLSLYLRTWQRPPEAETAPVIDPIYSVDADPATGAHVHEFPPGSRVDQWFTATQPKVIRLAAIIGRDPHTAPPPVPSGDPIGRVRFQLVDGDKLLADRTVEARNNVETVVALEAPARVEVGRRYVLRVTNRAGVVLGFYFNANPNPGDQAILYGAVDPPGVSAHEHALSGHVLAGPPDP